MIDEAKVQGHFVAIKGRCVVQAWPPNAAGEGGRWEEVAYEATVNVVSLEGMVRKAYFNKSRVSVDGPCFVEVVSAEPTTPEEFKGKLQ